MAKLVGYGIGTLTDAQNFNTAEKSAKGYPNPGTSTTEALDWYDHPNVADTRKCFPVTEDSEPGNRPGTIYTYEQVKVEGFFPELTY